MLQSASLSYPPILSESDPLSPDNEGFLTNTEDKLPPWVYITYTKTNTGNYIYIYIYFTKKDLPKVCLPILCSFLGAKNIM